MPLQSGLEFNIHLTLCGRDLASTLTCQQLAVSQANYQLSIVHYQLNVTFGVTKQKFTLPIRN
jgi:hypothetical protein